MADKNLGGAPEGNTNAAKEHRLITSALRRAVVQNPDKLRKACLKVLDEAEEGNLNAFNVIADRLDGKPHQSTSLEGPDGGPVKVEQIARQLLEPKAKDTDS